MLTPRIITQASQEHFCRLNPGDFVIGTKVSATHARDNTLVIAIQNVLLSPMGTYVAERTGIALLRHGVLVRIDALS